ncbi:MAG: LexA family transcriptional regulator [Bacteroidales bacterium]|nr:LexA family transcriptional regulator [Bacteroidales bacterium]
MSTFSRNIKLMRKRKKRTQDDVAFAMDIKRSTLSGYENDVAQPSVETLIAFSKYFNLAIDTLLKIDLGKLPESQLSQIERGYDTYIKGSQIRVLATTVDQDNNENIELVNEKAKAGYRTGYADPEYLKVLPTFQMPFLSRERKYRTFQISGDSMLPVPHGSWVTGEFIQNWRTIRSQQPYIILTVEDGVVFKIVENKLEERQQLRLHSLNPLYEPYYIDAKDIREVWKFVHYISSEVPEPNTPKEQILDAVKKLESDVRAIQTKLDI